MGDRIRARDHRPHACAQICPPAARGGAAALRDGAQQQPDWTGLRDHRGILCCRGGAERRPFLERSSPVRSINGFVDRAPRLFPLLGQTILPSSARDFRHDQLCRKQRRGSSRVDVGMSAAPLARLESGQRRALRGRQFGLIRECHAAICHAGAATCNMCRDQLGSVFCALADLLLPPYPDGAIQRNGEAHAIL